MPTFLSWFSAVWFWFPNIEPVVLFYWISAPVGLKCSVLLSVWFLHDQKTIQKALKSIESTHLVITTFSEAKISYKAPNLKNK